MPNLTAHLGMAKDVAKRLRHPIIDNHLGSFLLGSVSPDIRIITKNNRYDTHFVGLDFESHGSGLEGMFNANPDLADSCALNGPTKAFIVGYVSHLFADEFWILDFYRPYFGNLDVYQSTLVGQIMDRALQLELDRREEINIGGLNTLKPLIMNAEEGVEIGFISAETMTEWRKWIQVTLDWSFDWSRLSFMARRVVARYEDDLNLEAEGIVKTFLGSTAQGIESIYKLVPETKIDVFREKNITAVSKFAKEYLN